MQAIQMTRHGSPDVLVLTDVPTPVPGPGQVLIKVESAGVNYADLIRRRNDPYPFPTPLPFTPGGEVAGRVEAVGAGVEAPPVGSAVFALVGDDGANGYAQYALADAARVVPLPPSITVDAAAGIIVAGTTAMLTLGEVARLGSGETVLVQGAGGGVGGYAVQLAKLLGATVLATASTEARRAAAKALGADHVLDSTTDWAAEVLALTNGRGADVVLDLGGGASFEHSLASLAPFGRLVVLGMASGAPLTLTDTTIRRCFYDPAPNQSLHAFNLGMYFGLRPAVAGHALMAFIAHVAAGEIAVPVGAVLPLSGAAEAHRLIESRQSTGKVVLKPWLETDQ